MPSSLPSFTNNNNILTIAESLKNNTLLYKFRNLRPPDFLCWPETWFHNPTPSHAPTLDTWKDFTLPPTIVSYPARWSFSLILGPLHWRLIVSDPAVDRIGRFWPFLCKNFLLYRWRSRICFVWCGGILPPKPAGKVDSRCFSEVT